MDFDWKPIAATLVKFGAPIIGTALGGPLGGTLGGALGGVVAAALGVEPTPDAVSNAIATGDPAQVTAALSSADEQMKDKLQALTAVVQASAATDQKNIEAVNASMQAELGKVGFWHWRNLLGYVVGFQILVFPTAILAQILFGRDPSAVIAFTSGGLISILAIGAGLLGFVANDTSNLKIIAQTGEAPPTLMGSIASRISGKKK